MRFPLVVAWLFYLAAQIAGASEVGGTPMGSIRFVSRDRADPVIITATQNAHRVTSFRVRAFHRSYALSAAQLQTIRDFTATGIEVAGEGAYVKYGGSSLYLTLYGELSDHSRASALIEVSEQRSITITKPQSI